MQSKTIKRAKLNQMSELSEKQSEWEYAKNSIGKGRQPA